MTMSKLCFKSLKTAFYQHNAIRRFNCHLSFKDEETEASGSEATHSKISPAYTLQDTP